MKTFKITSLLAVIIIMSFGGMFQSVSGMQFLSSLSSLSTNIATSAQKFSQSQLYNALYNHNIYRATLLFNMGVRHAQTVSENHYVLFTKAIMAQRIDIIELMLKNGMNPNARNVLTDDMPLHYAIQHNNKNTEKICVLLLQYGADLAAQNRFGNTPLHTALLSAKNPHDTLQGTVKQKIGFLLNIAHGICFGAQSTKTGEAILHHYMQNLLAKRCKSRAVSISQYTTESFGNLENIPEEVQVGIISLLDKKAVDAMSAVSRGTRSCALDSSLDRKYVEDGIETLLKIKNKNGKTVGDLADEYENVDYQRLFSRDTIKKLTKNIVA